MLISWSGPSPELIQAMLSPVAAVKSSTEVAAPVPAPAPAGSTLTYESAAVSEPRALPNGAKRIQVDPDLVISSKEPEINFLTGVSIFRGGVKAEYGETVLTADTLIIRQPTNDPKIDSEPVEIPELGIKLMPKEAYATGQVKIDDPMIQMEARNLQFKWSEGMSSARAEAIKIMVGPAKITAELAINDADGWLLTKVEGTTCRNNLPIYRVRMDSLRLNLGKQGSAKGVRLGLFGTDLPKIPRFSFSLDQRQRGLTLPNLTIRRQEGIGFSWNANSLINSSTMATARINSFKNFLPTTQFQLTKTFVNDPNSRALLEPIADLGERFVFSYFRNVYTLNMEDEANFLRDHRSTVTVGTGFNVGSFGRFGDFERTYSREWDITAEQSGPMGKLNHLTQVRAMSFRQDGTPFRPRFTANTSIGTPMMQSGRFQSILRADLATHVGDTTYSWAGLEAGGSYAVAPYFKVGVSAYSYADFGQAQYDLDRLVSNRGVTIRADLLGKSFKGAILWTWDPNLGWFNLQYRFAQVIGCLEPVLVYRRFPTDYQFGLRFRLDEVLEILQQKNFRRTKTRNNIKSTNQTEL